MKQVILLALLLLNLNIINAQDHKTIAKTDTKEQNDCTFNGIQLWGKVKFVDSFPDIKIQFVESFPDIKVKMVSSFADRCGLWEKTDSFPDIKVQVVTSFPDIKVQLVDSFPGMVKN